MNETGSPTLDTLELRLDGFLASPGAAKVGGPVSSGGSAGVGAIAVGAAGGRGGVSGSVAGGGTTSTGEPCDPDVDTDCTATEPPPVPPAPDLVALVQQSTHDVETLRVTQAGIFYGLCIVILLLTVVVAMWVVRARR